MILIDTSAWIEFFRDTGSPVCDEVDRLIGSDIAVCDPIVMEVLAGARDEAHLQALRRLMATATCLAVERRDYEDAAFLFRSCRRAGFTVRKLVDCLIASVAIRSGTPVLHSDVDFTRLAGCTALEVHEPGR